MRREADSQRAMRRTPLTLYRSIGVVVIAIIPSIGIRLREGARFFALISPHPFHSAGGAGEGCRDVEGALHGS